jgi:hypothetical protein
VIEWQRARARGGRLLLAAALAGCGGSLVDPNADGGRRRDAGPGASDAAGDADGPPVFIDDICIDAAKIPPSLACDPFAPTCPAGKGCYAIPPRASGSCQPGTYGTICATEGKGAQGAPCNDTTECLGGHVCVKSGLGNHCAKLCKVSDPGSCGDGRVCRVLDLSGSGWGGCE